MHIETGTAEIEKGDLGSFGDDVGHTFRSSFGSPAATTKEKNEIVRISLPGIRRRHCYSPEHDLCHIWQLEQHSSNSHIRQLGSVADFQRSDETGIHLVREFEGN